MRISDKIKENQIFFIAFVLLLFNSLCFIQNTGLDSLMKSYYSPLYVVNYDCGYSSRLLIGAIFSLFIKEKLNYYVIVIIMLAVYFLFCLCFSLILNKYLKKSDFKIIKIYVIFMIATPFFVAMLDYLGTTDVFWIFITMFSLWAVDKKGIRWLVPILGVFGIAIHEFFTITYMIPCAIMILYQYTKKPSVMNFIFVAISAVLLIIASGYFLFVGSDTMKMTEDEMVNYAKDRLNLCGKPMDEFYVRAIFFWEKFSNISPDSPLYLQYINELTSSYTLNDHNVINLFYYIISVVVATSIPFVILFHKSIKSEKIWFRKLPYILSLFPVPLSVIYLLTSTDDSRFIMHFLVIIIFLMLFFIKEKDKNFEDSYLNISKTISKNKIIIALLSLTVLKMIFTEVKF